MNDIVNNFLLPEDEFMPEMHLKQPGYTYSACGPFTKNKERCHPFSKIFNKNTVKRSFSSARNMAAFITFYNQIVLNSSIENFGCNCRNKQNCTLDNKYLTLNVVYEAIVTNDKDNHEKIYFGLYKTPLKERCNNHTKSFRNEASNKETELSKYIWLLKDNDKAPSFKWSILQQLSAKSKYNFCKIFVKEKLYDQFFQG